MDMNHLVKVSGLLEFMYTIQLNQEIKVIDHNNRLIDRTMSLNTINTNRIALPCFIALHNILIFNE